MYEITLTLTPRIVVSGLAGYHCLGFAYELGIMASIDRIAIQTLRPRIGYAGLGVFMPKFQWYASWGVRLSAMVAAGLLYDIIERIVRLLYTFFFTKREERQS